VQRTSEYLGDTIYPQAYFFKRKDAEKFLKKKYPKVRECPFYRKLEIEVFVVMTCP